MVSRLRSAVESTPVSDCAVGQGDKTAASRDRKRKSSDPQATQEEACYPGQTQLKSRRLSHASSRPDGRRGDDPLHTSQLIATPAPLGRQRTPGTKPQPQPPPPTRPRTVQRPIASNHARFESSCYGGETSDVDVALIGPSPHGAEDKKQFSFFDFPAEIRNIIYDHTLHWPDCVDLYRCFYRQIPTHPSNDDNTDSKPHPSQYQRRFKTPTILLLCRRITEESLPILKSRWLVIDRLPPFVVPGGLMRLTDFIGRRTLQGAHHIDLRIGLGEGPLGSGWIWTRLLDDLLAVLGERNALAKLRLLIRMCNRPMASRWDQERRYNQDIRKVCLIFHTHPPTARPIFRCKKGFIILLTQERN